LHIDRGVAKKIYKEEIPSTRGRFLLSRCTMERGRTRHIELPEASGVACREDRNSDTKSLMDGRYSRTMGKRENIVYFDGKK
jgi:hypothetical protein